MGTNLCEMTELRFVRYCVIQLSIGVNLGKGHSWWNTSFR